ncbi:carbamoyltransferase family protein [Algoriphagus hitonicola]|uniref:Carbamoyltransferase n=1 Tax=Algoriphagus hitonicola TaxID=435880 RepID=A0A1I2X7F8_9BACT|nr:carbamoyltransferase [Algoriphagus hitonicola]SFH07901.1 carbamoyltransferase [Algoriphagus hitonicola]
MDSKEDSKARKILGISAFYHDSAAAVIEGGNIIAAAQEERFTRTKHTPDFPIEAIKYCLEESGFSISELDAIVFYDKPLLKFERLLETYYGFAPKGFLSFSKSMPVWLDEKLFLKKKIYEGLAEIEDFNKKDLNLLFCPHHLSHAASAYFTSNFSESAILTIDGVGEWSTASISHGKNNEIIEKKSLNFPHSVGLLYSAFTYFLGFRVNSGEYKLMGLAPYGISDSKQTKEFELIIRESIIKIFDDGSIWLDQDYFDYATGLKMIVESKWEKLFGLKTRKPTDEIQQMHCDLALAIQRVTEDIVLKMALEAKRLTGSKNLCMAGGVALNCVANGKIVKEKIFENVYIQPAAGDAGGALGAALAIHHIFYGNSKLLSEKYDQMKGSYLGPEYSSKEIIQVCKKNKAVYSKFDDFQKLCEKIAGQIADGKVVGWFQGRMEFGPRALGNRSILGDARNPEMQKKLNLKIKYREGFRPFAPSVLEEDRTIFFDLEDVSPYMLLVAPVKESRRKDLPPNYHNMDLWERLYHPRSDVQSITHLDYSARIQTVTPDTNSNYYNLISEFKKLTGYGLLVNTSFNVRGEPIVCTPEDAYRCFMSTDMDYLVINDFVFRKEDQPDWENKSKWMLEFKED